MGLSSTSSAILPSFTPPASDKSRLSPAPESSPSFASSPPVNSPVRQVFYPTLDAAGRPRYVSEPDRGEIRGVGRRGSKQRDWRAGLGVVDEEEAIEQ